MDSGKAFDKPLPSVEVLKKFQVPVISCNPTAPPPPPHTIRRLPKAWHTSGRLNYLMPLVGMPRRSKLGIKSGRRRSGSATSSASEWLGIVEKVSSAQRLGNMLWQDSRCQVLMLIYTSAVQA